MRNEMPTGERDEELEAYLDGRLDPAARDAFERSLSTHAARRQALQLQRQIDQRLQRSLLPPAVPALRWPVESPSDAPRLKEESSTEPATNGKAKVNGHARATKPAKAHSAVSGSQGIGRFLPLGGIGLALVVLGGLLWWAFASQRPVRVREQSLADVYAQVESGDLFIEVQPSEAKRFSHSFYNRNRRALQLSPLPASHEILGLAFLPALSPASTVIAARVDGQPVAVVVDHRRSDRAEEASFRGLYVHRGELGPLVLYEISPFEHSAILPFLGEAADPHIGCEDDEFPVR